jgi:hypothetical protein
MNQQITGPANGATTAHELFALTDEQILEIEPEAEPPGLAHSVISSEARNLSSASVTSQAPQAQRDSSSAPRNDSAVQGADVAAGATRESQVTGHGTWDTGHTPQEPPPWLAAQMKDPWTGEEARELWNGVQQAKSEAAAYRAALATPEDARALKELYPGGVKEARATAERARVLDDIDRAYFGTTGKSAQEVSASRAQLAQHMLREDPAAFREMVFAGLRALEDAGKQAGATAVGATLASPGNHGAGAAGGGASGPASAAPSDAGAPAAAGAPAGDASAHEAHVAAYAAFEQAANDDLERSVGGAIERTLAQALPNASRLSNSSDAGAQHPDQIGTGAAPLQARLSQAIRQDVEAALKGDRQLGEQVAQILSARRLDNETRAQVVRLIGERAQQLVPVAAKRVLNDWTQATLSAHRDKSARADATSARREVAPASSPAGSAASSNRTQTQAPNRGPARSDPRRVDYRKLSDEQILDL